MTGQRKYRDNAQVDVWRKNRDEWVKGTVFGYEERDGVWKYYVQLSGYAAAHPSDPNSWFTDEELRPSDGFSFETDDS